jgi:hypothetical protein
MSDDQSPPQDVFDRDRPPPGGYPPEPPPPPATNPPRYREDSRLAPHRGVIILILGICSMVVNCFILGIIAWAMGNKDLREIDEGRMDPAGRGMTQAGRIVGMIHVIASCVVFLLLLIGLVVWLVSSAPLD